MYQCYVSLVKSPLYFINSKVKCLEISMAERVFGWRITVRACSVIQPIWGCFRNRGSTGSSVMPADMRSTWKNLTKTSVLHQDFKWYCKWSEPLRPSATEASLSWRLVENCLAAKKTLWARCNPQKNNNRWKLSKRACKLLPLAAYPSYPC